MTDIASYPYTRYDSYVPSIEVNPASVFYQRISSQNVSNTNCQFTVRSPSSRAYLQSKAMIEWALTLKRVRTDGNSIPIGTATSFGSTSGGVTGGQDFFCLKPTPLPISNSFSSITCSVNGSSSTISQPRRIFDCISQCLVSREDSNKFSTKYPDSMGGVWNTDANPGQPSAGVVLDHAMMENYNNLNLKVLRAVNQNNYVPAVVRSTVKILENLICPPFDCYAEINKFDQPYWSPWKYMSQSIPNIQSLEIDIQMIKLAASSIFYQYSKNAAGAGGPTSGIEIDTASPNQIRADLLLYWSEQNPQAEIPRSVDLQTYQIREFQKDIAGPNGIKITNQISDLIQLQSVPSCIIVHVEKNKDDPRYACTAQTSDDDQTGGNPGVTGTGHHSWDSFAEINSLTVVLGSKPNVISTNFSQEELYRLTEKNCRALPYSFTDHQGRLNPNVAGNELVVDAAYKNYATKSMIVLTPQDLAEKTSTGVFSSNSIQVTIDTTPRDGFAGYDGGDQSWKFYVHLIYSKELLRIEPDKASFVTQNVDENVARKLTSQAPRDMSGSGLRVGGGLSVGGRRRRVNPLSKIRSRV